MRITGTITSSFSDVVIEGVMVRIRVIATPEQVDAMPATVDIYPHAEFMPANMECTPENYAHALARLAHAEDHLAREVRSSQALQDKCATLEAAARRRDEQAEASDAYVEETIRNLRWREYLDLRRQLREATDEAAQADLAERLSAIGRAHNFDAPARMLETAQADLAAARRQIEALRLAHEHGMPWFKIDEAMRELEVNEEFQGDDDAHAALDKT